MRALLLIGVLAACGASSVPLSPLRESRISLEVKKATLQNGLRVVLVRDPRAAEVQVTMQYKVGSIDDPAGQEGMAHLVEHLMFQQVLGAQSLFAKLEDTATFFNAWTTGEATTFTARARPERLDELLSIEAVRVGFRCTSITESAFAREREVVLRELQLKDAAREVMQVIHAGAYPEGHPYRRMYAGHADGVAKITREQACIFADTFYTTTNAVLVVSGDLTPERVDQALNKFLGRVQKREAFPRRATVGSVPGGRHATAETPFDREALLFTWPLPADPAERLKVRTSAQVTEAIIDSAIRGTTVSLEIGDTQAPVLCIAVEPDGPQGDIEQNVRDALAKAERRERSLVGNFIFDLLHQQAVNGVFAHYEAGNDRDAALAASVHAGRDPTLLLAADSSALRTLTYEGMQRVLHEHLSAKQMSVVTLKPRADTKVALPAAIAAPVHDIGQRRDSADPADAKLPHREPIALPPLTGMRKLALANGLDVVLLPITSVPTVEMRLVFDVGTADEPAQRRGAALVAAHALAWPRGRGADLVNYAAAGARKEVVLDGDTTAFVARGLDMHVDFLLTGLARLVREGSYHTKSLQRMRDASFEETAPLDDAWRAAIFGAAHPYTRGGLARYIDPALTIEDVLTFRARYYTPKNATLVIAGKFDAQLAQAWIEYLFADWTGDAPPPRTTPRASVQPVSLATDEDVVQTRVHIALPATGSRPVQLVLAEMLDQITSDVRHQLGASYGFDASLAQHRQSAYYDLDGYIDAARTQEALELVRSRIGALREDPELAARAFVAARKRVLTHLGALTGSAHEVAERTHADLVHGRPPMSDATAAAEVRQLTIDQVATAIRELDLARGAVFMRGPAEHVDRAFAALGRTPQRIAKAKRPARETALAPDEDDELDAEYGIDDTPLPASQRLTFSATVGYGAGTLRQHDTTGFSVAADAGYRVRRDTTLGIHAGYGRASGTYKERELGPTFDIAGRGFQLGGFIQANFADRLWLSAIVGLNIARIDDMEDESYVAPIGGLQAGFDVLALGRNRLALYGRLDTELFTETSSVLFSLGLGYRRW